MWWFLLILLFSSVKDRKNGFQGKFTPEILTVIEKLLFICFGSTSGLLAGTLCSEKEN
jgi:hypothetical protein